MKLKRLVVQGFKSFKDRTTIHFDKGITGIVGPNGCGKSNIVDSLFWIMGAQSAKHLRGDNMKDLIFAGSSKYTPGNWAEANLVLENTEGKHIHIGNKVVSPTEIQLTRKLYRNGETEYRINNEPCRLRDIQEVFMDTGAGAKSYSIIAQGEINRLVQSKPQERRTMIEEVAGITKFKVRKRESMRKIEATQSNLARLQDLKVEIEKNLRSLQKQAEKAERARTLKEKIKRNDLVVQSHKVFDALKLVRDSRNSSNQMEIDLETWKTRKNKLEVDLEEERIEKDEQTNKIELLQSEYNEISRQLAGNEEKLNSLCNSQTQKEKELAHRETELQSLKEEAEERANKLQELEEALAQAKEAASEEIDFEEFQVKVEDLKEQFEQQEISLNDLRDDLETKRTELSETDREYFKVTSKLEEYASNLEDITTEIDELENRYSGVSTEISDQREEVNALEEKIAKASTDEEEKRTKAKEEKEQIKVLTEEFNNLNRELVTIEGKLNSLKELNESLEGVERGTTTFLEQAAEKGYALFGSIVRCDDKYSAGVHSVIGDLLEMVISSNDSSEELKEWISGENNDPLSFLTEVSGEEIADSEIIQRLEVNGCTGIVPLADVVEVPAEYKDKVNKIFRGCYLVESLDYNTFEKSAKEIGFKAIADYSGKIAIRKTPSSAEVLLNCGQKSSGGIVERNNKIEALEKELEAKTTEKNSADEKLLEAQKTYEELEQKLDEVRLELNTLREDYAGKKSSLESKLASYETSNSRLEILKKRKVEYSKSRLELLEQEDKFLQSKNDLEAAIEELDEQLEDRKASFDDAKALYEEERATLLAKQAEAKTIHDRLASMESQATDVSSQIEKLAHKEERVNEMINEYREDISKIEEGLKELEQANLETAETLQEKEEVLSLLKDRLAELLAGMQEREDEVKKLGQSISKSEKSLVEIEMKRDQAIEDEEELVRNIFEKYQIDLRNVLGKFLEFEEADYECLKSVESMFVMETENGIKEIEVQPYEFNRRYGQDLKDCGHKLKQYKTEYNRLGEINWQAVEDYDRQKLRFDFLNVQEGELKESLEDLESAISKIDEKSRIRFKIAFEEVNTRFEKVFPIIFGGGQAKLKINGDIDDPECGVEIIAQPPGKKMQNINLMSGGEKALTAVSLIFSIFLVKPSPFCLLDEVDAPLDDANVGRFNELLREMSKDSQFILITHNKKTMELNDTLYGVTMQEPGVSKAVSVQLH